MSLIPVFEGYALWVEITNPWVRPMQSRSFYAEGKPYSVRYDQVNAMLLNEFLKEHQKVQQQEAAIAQLKADAANQEAAMGELKTTLETVVSRLNKHESKIERVTDRFELSKPATQLAVNQP